MNTENIRFCFKSCDACGGEHGNLREFIMCNVKHETDKAMQEYMKFKTANHLSMPVDEIEFSPRTANCLQNAKIRTVGQLANRNRYELLRLRNFGRVSLIEVVMFLYDKGLSLRGDHDK